MAEAKDPKESTEEKDLETEDDAESGVEEEEEESEDGKADDSKVEKKPEEPLIKERNRIGFKFRQEKKKAKPEVDKGEEEEDGAEEQPDVAKEVEKATKPIISHLQSQQDAVEISQFLSESENSHFKKYEGTVRKAAPVYANVPIDLLFKAFAYDDAMKLGAEKAAEAKAGDKKNNTTGKTTRKVKSSTPDFKAMTPAQVEEYNRTHVGQTVRPDEE